MLGHAGRGGRLPAGSSVGPTPRLRASARRRRRARRARRDASRSLRSLLRPARSLRLAAVPLSHRVSPPLPRSAVSRTDESVVRIERTQADGAPPARRSAQRGAATLDVTWRIWRVLRAPGWRARVGPRTLPSRAGRVAWPRQHLSVTYARLASLDGTGQATSRSGKAFSPIRRAPAASRSLNEAPWRGARRRCAHARSRDSSSDSAPGLRSNGDSSQRTSIQLSSAGPIQGVEHARA
jgi:hypothetical protein